MFFCYICNDPPGLLSGSSCNAEVTLPWHKEIRGTDKYLAIKVTFDFNIIKIDERKPVNGNADSNNTKL